MTNGAGSRRIVVNLPNRPKGAMVGIPSLGRFENGKEHTVSKEQVERFERRKGRDLPKVFGESLPQTQTQTQTQTPTKPETTETEES